MSVERIAKWPPFTYHKLNEHKRACGQCLYSLLACINPSNSMIMQAVSLLSLNVLMLFFLLFFALSLMRWTTNTTTYLLLWEQGMSESPSWIRMRENEMKKKIFIDWWWWSFRIHQLNFHFFLKDKKRKNDYCVNRTTTFFVWYIYMFVCAYDWTQDKRKEKGRDRPAR
jgi:hypothetical protein